MAQTVQFHHPDGIQIYRVPTPAIAAVLHRVWSGRDLWVLTYRGSPEDLIAAELADAGMLDLRGNRYERVGTDEFGDRYVIARRARGTVQLTRWHDADRPDPASFGAAQVVVAGWLAG